MIKENNNRKINWIVALLLSFVGFDRLYLGEYKTGIMKIIFIYFIVFIASFLLATPNVKTVLKLIVFSALIYIFDIIKILIYRERIKQKYDEDILSKIFIKKDNVASSNNSNGIIQLNYHPMLMLSIVCGLLGVDRFLMGKKNHKIARLKFFTLGGLGILYVMDIIRISRKSSFNSTVCWLDQGAEQPIKKEN